MNNKTVVWAVVVIVVAVVGYFGLKAAKHALAPAPVQPAAVAPTEATSPSASPSSAMISAREITVSGNEFMFDPAAITAKKGETLKITFKNVGKFPHNFTISDLNVGTKTIQPGESDTVQFAVDKTGIFGYKCTVDSHADKGMTGTLTVQ